MLKFVTTPKNDPVTLLGTQHVVCSKHKSWVEHRLTSTSSRFTWYRAQHSLPTWPITWYLLLNSQALECVTWDLESRDTITWEPSEGGRVYYECYGGLYPFLVTTTTLRINLKLTFRLLVMCRTCKAENPKWSKGVRVPVKDLPLFFASQPSWNFEQKIYGHNVVVSKPSWLWLTFSIWYEDYFCGIWRGFSLRCSLFSVISKPVYLEYA